MRLIELSAVDGAGKSTVASRIATRVRSRGESVVVLHWPSDSLLGFLPDESTRGIATLVDAFDGDSSADGTDRPPGTTVPGTLRSPLGAAFDYVVALVFTLKLWFVLLNYLLVIPYLVVRYRDVDYVVLDRCAFDDLLQLEYRGVPRGLVRAGLALIRTGDCYCLEVGPRTAAARDRGADGSDHADDYYDRKSRLYRGYARRHGVTRVDATARPSTIARAILRDGR
ncbi:nucleoside/nucleotide kinase family protein [Natronococcus roseus]|uniref:hypothetical protein n=1 Tax=Natronococcus roseus TaxID=1052014 RepID=UPI00374CF800